MRFHSSNLSKTPLCNAFLCLYFHPKSYSTAAGIDWLEIGCSRTQRETGDPYDKTTHNGKVSEKFSSFAFCLQFDILSKIPWNDSHVLILTGETETTITVTFFPGDFFFFWKIKSRTLIRFHEFSLNLIIQLSIHRR